MLYRLYPIIKCTSFSLPVSSDFNEIDVSLSFQEGASVSDGLCFPFDPNDDIIPENTESLILIASSTAGELLFTTGGDTTTIEIRDDG